MAETTDNKIQFGMRMDADLHGAIAQLAEAEERSVSNTIQWLLKQDSRVQELLGTANAEAVGGN